MPDWSPLSPVWCFLFTTWGKSIPLSVWATTLYIFILESYLGQYSLLFSALNSFFHCLFLWPGSIRLVWLGFVYQNRCLCIYHNIEIQIGHSFQFCVTQIIAIGTRNPFSNSQSFVKEAATWFVVVYITVELSSLSQTFLSQEINLWNKLIIWTS